MVSPSDPLRAADDELGPESVRSRRVLVQLERVENFAFPPFPLIPLVLAELVEDGAWMIL